MAKIKPFDFNRLPRELKLHVLPFTDLVHPCGYLKIEEDEVGFYTDCCDPLSVPGLARQIYRRQGQSETQCMHAMLLARNSNRIPT